MKKSNILSRKMISVCLALACALSMAFMTSCGSEAGVESSDVPSGTESITSPSSDPVSSDTESEPSSSEAESEAPSSNAPSSEAESKPAPDNPTASSEPPASNKNTTESAQEYQVLEQNAEALEKYLRDNLSPEDHGGIYLEKWGLGKDGGIFLYVWTVDASALDSTLAAYTGESFPVERLDARCSMAQLLQLKEDIDSIAADENAQIVYAVSETGNLVSITVSGTDFDRISSEIRQAASKLQIPDECVMINKPLSENPVTSEKVAEQTQSVNTPPSLGHLTFRGETVTDIYALHAHNHTTKRYLGQNSYPGFDESRLMELLEQMPEDTRLTADSSQSFIVFTKTGRHYIYMDPDQTPQELLDAWETITLHQGQAYNIHWLTHMTTSKITEVEYSMMEARGTITDRESITEISRFLKEQLQINAEYETEIFDGAANPATVGSLYTVLIKFDSGVSYFIMGYGDYGEIEKEGSGIWIYTSDLKQTISYQLVEGCAGKIRSFFAENF